jgi:hypothetical protein
MAFPPIPIRNQLLASRERLAREERAAVARVHDLRWVKDSMTEELAQRPLDTAKGAALIVAAGDLARAGNPVRLPPRGSTARLIVLAGRKARGEEISDPY